MINAAVYLISSGVIIRRVSVLLSHLDAQCRGGEEYYLNCPDSATHIINNEPVTIIPEPIPLTLAETKTAKRAGLKRARDNAELSGFTYLEKPFDSDEKSIRRLSVAVDAARTALSLNVPFTITWTCADDTTIDLTGEQMLMLSVAMAQSGNDIHTKYRTLKVAVNQASTAEEVAAIVW